MTTTTQQDALIDAAEERAKLYDDDDRECIKADVMNAFFAGAEWSQAAANKAAEEELVIEARRWAGAATGYDAKLVRSLADALDRASRQVANKAEVDLPMFDERGPFYELFKFTVGSLAVHDFKEADEIGQKFRALLATPPATTGCAEARHSGAMPKDLAIQCLNALDVDSEAHAALSKFIIEGGAVGASKESVLSSLTDERKRAMFEEWATKQGSYDLSPYNWRVKSVRSVPYTGYVRPYKQDRTVHAFEGFIAALGEVGASTAFMPTVLTDERVLQIRDEVAKEWESAGKMTRGAARYFARAIEREVAAQAGQVAVPEADLLQIDRELESIPALMDKNYKGCVREAIRNIQALLAKSSPAKESLETNQVQTIAERLKNTAGLPAKESK